ncbi:uncharacterized protein LOC135847875 [Planococcus citri]|uniref:uncharacterized protein LOC135847875 n=1 Tax=Planococcus citri TaxID=170843 RepID=UPI0031F8CB6C
MNPANKMCSILQYFTVFFIFLINEEIKNCLPANLKDPQVDAKAIVDSKFDHKTVAKILPFRTQEECDAINKAVASFNAGKPLVDPKYIPLQSCNPYDDLVFALINDRMTVYSMYLGEYLFNRDETFIIMVFVQVDDRTAFIDLYNKQHTVIFDDARRSNRHPFQNALRVWAEENRQGSPPECAINGCCSKGQFLQDERSLWNKKKRDDLEYVLMKQSFDDSKCSIHCYGTRMPEQPANFLDDIKNNIDNQDLVDLYSSLVNYIQNQDEYLAKKLHDYCNGQDNWAVWIIILSTRRGDPMKLIDTAFQGLYQNVTLKDYITKCDIQDPIFKDMLTNLVDPVSIKDRQKPPPPPAPPSESEADLYEPSSENDR